MIFRHQKSLLLGLLLSLPIIIAVPIGIWIIVTANPAAEHFTIPESGFIQEETVPIGYSETKGEIVEETGRSCNISEDCPLDPKWAIQSNCPYQSRCVDKQCVVICPTFEQNISEGTKMEQRVDWDTAEQAIMQCYAQSVMQNHQMEVWITLKDGQRLYTIEPKIDAAIYTAHTAQERCKGTIEIITE